VRPEVKSFVVEAKDRGDVVEGWTVGWPVAVGDEGLAEFGWDLFVGQIGLVVGVFLERTSFWLWVVVAHCVGGL